MSVLVQVADALAAELSTHAFSQALAAARSYADSEAPLEADENVLACDVVPAAEVRTELEDRQHVRYQAECHIVLRKKFPAADIEQIGATEQTRVKQAAVDPLVSLVEEIHEHLAKLPRLPTFAEAIWAETRIRAAVVHIHLRTRSQYTGIISSTYEVVKAL